MPLIVPQVNFMYWLDTDISSYVPAWSTFKFKISSKIIDNFVLLFAFSNSFGDCAELVLEACVPLLQLVLAINSQINCICIMCQIYLGKVGSHIGCSLMLEKFSQLEIVQNRLNVNINILKTQ